MTTMAERLIGTQELSAALEARGYAYRLLIHAFAAEPTTESVKYLRESGVLGVFPFRQENEQIRQGALRAEGCLTGPDGGSGHGIDRLRWDFTRLFVGPDRLPAPPWESAYRDEDRLLFTEDTLAVRAAYLRQGLRVANFQREADDHISLELAFMYETCRSAAEAAERGETESFRTVLAEQSRFLDEHLLRWVPAFSTDVVRHAETDFYRGMAQILDTYVKMDRRLLAELLTEEPLN